MFGKSPAIDYLGIQDNYNRFKIDVACAAACWEEENMLYEKSRKTAQQEAVSRDDYLENYKKQLANK